MMSYKSQSHKQQLDKDQLYYDSHCPLCEKEIRLLKRLSRSQLAFVDVHSLSPQSTPSKQQMLQRLHLRKANGNWLTGLDATVHAWSHTPYAVFFKVLQLWPISYIADRAYSLWAKRRYKKRYKCQQCTSTKPITAKNSP